MWGLEAADAEVDADVADLHGDEAVEAVDLLVVGGGAGGECGGLGSQRVVGLGAVGGERAVPGADRGPVGEAGPGDVGDEPGCFLVISARCGGARGRDGRLELRAVPAVDGVAGLGLLLGFVGGAEHGDFAAGGVAQLDGFVEGDGFGLEVERVPELPGRFGLAHVDDDLVLDAVADGERADGDLELALIAVERGLGG